MGRLPVALWPHEDDLHTHRVATIGTPQRPATGSDMKGCHVSCDDKTAHAKEAMLIRQVIADHDNKDYLDPNVHTDPGLGSTQTNPVTVLSVMVSTAVFRVPSPTDGRRSPLYEYAEQIGCVILQDDRILAGIDQYRLLVGKWKQLNLEP